MHRPYERMPLNSLGFSYLSGLAHDGAAGKAELARYCDAANLGWTTSSPKCARRRISWRSRSAASSSGIRGR